MKLGTLCYLKANGKTLMMHRVKKQNDMHEGKWNGLGGKFIPGESPEECAIREVEEESGLTMLEPRFRGMLTFPTFDDIDDWYVFVYTSEHFEGEQIESDEGILKWIDDEEILRLPLWEGDRIFLKWLDQDIFFSAKFTYKAGALEEHEVVFYE